MGTVKSKILYFLGGIVLLAFAGLALYYFFTTFFKSAPERTGEALTLSAVVLIGLALVVLLMAVLVIVYSNLELANATQALALPEGSIRALIAFSLLLIFTCLAAFLYNGVNGIDISPDGKTLAHISKAQVDELKKQFVVAYGPAKNPDGSLSNDAFDATYFSRRSKEADDFAKQIFTTLATVFVSVISFYFGSSATASAAAKATRDGSDGGKDGAQAGLDDAQTAAHDAQSAADRAAAAAASAKSIASDAVPTPTIVQKSADAATAALKARQQVEKARKAVADAAAAGADAVKVSSAVADAIKARDAARQLAEEAKQSAAAAEELLNTAKSKLGIP